MTLSEILEPILQYMCRLNRSARNGAQLDADQTRVELKNLIGHARTQAGGAGLAEQFGKIELPLVFFIDFTIKEGQYNVSRKWKEIAFDYNELGGDEKFFDLLEETLKETGPAADERLTIFYELLGLGFSGWYVGQPEFLRKKQKEIFARIGGVAPEAESRKICPDAYEHVNTENLIEPPGARLLAFGVVLVVCVVGLFVANVYLYHQSVDALNQSLNVILHAHVSH
jgi:type VI protein secretion system component VasF